MKLLAVVFFTTTAVALSGCAPSAVSYMPPVRSYSSDTSKVIARSRDAVWSAAVPSLGKDFFVINNMDKASGLINVSYSGDPHDYVDCGHVRTSFDNASGHHEYAFDGSAKDAVYTLYKYPLLVNVHRQMDLDGRVNIIFETVSDTSTKITVNARYVVRRQVNARASNGQGGNQSDSVAFSSRGHGAFPVTDNNQQTECVPTGKLERDILSLIQ